MDTPCSDEPQRKRARRSNQEWVEELSNTHHENVQIKAHRDLANYLFVVAYNYLNKRRENLQMLSQLPNEEIASLAEDAVQDFMEKLVRDEYALLSSYRASGRFTSWAAQIVCNQLCSELRKVGWQRQERISEVCTISTQDQGLPSPYASVVQGQTHELLQSCMNKLPERYRLALIRRVVDGEKAKDIAADLKVTPNTVHILVYRAKQQMRQLVMNEGLEPTF